MWKIPGEDLGWPGFPPGLRPIAGGVGRSAMEAAGHWLGFREGLPEFFPLPAMPGHFFTRRFYMQLAVFMISPVSFFFNPHFDPVADIFRR